MRPESPTAASIEAVKFPRAGRSTKRNAPLIPKLWNASVQNEHIDIARTNVLSDGFKLLIFQPPVIAFARTPAKPLSADRIFVGAELPLRRRMSPRRKSTQLT